MSETSLPTAQGLSITFTQHQYGGYGVGGPGVPGGADGISFFLAVAPPSPVTLGPQGGSLGYASAGSSAGLPGGWLGIGLDAFGNFSNPSFGGSTCAVPAWAGFTPDAITVRGPGHGTTGYCLLSSSADPNATGLSASLRGADRSSSARTIQIVIDANAGTYTVNIDPAGGTDFELATSGPLPTSYYDPATGQLVNGIPPADRVRIRRIHRLGHRYSRDHEPQCDDGLGCRAGAVAYEAQFADDVARSG